MDNLYYSIGQNLGMQDARNGKDMRDLSGMDSHERQGYVDGYNDMLRLWGFAA